jgi:hypothetical protein
MAFPRSLEKNVRVPGTNQVHPALSRLNHSSDSTECEQRAMATDYDAPRKSEEDLNEDSIEELKTRRAEKPTAVVEEDETELADGYVLPGADLSGEELLVRVLPAQSDEFTCASCFLVRHRSQIAREKNGLLYCRDCEG